MISICVYLNWVAYYFEPFPCKIPIFSPLVHSISQASKRTNFTPTFSPSPQHQFSFIRKSSLWKFTSFRGQPINGPSSMAMSNSQKLSLHQPFASPWIWRSPGAHAGDVAGRGAAPTIGSRLPSTSWSTRP